MATRSLFCKSANRLADCSVYKKDDVPVQGNLALTPAKIQELTAKGIAVTQSNIETKYESDAERGDFVVDPLFTRGMDQNTLWENAQVSKRKILANRDRISKHVRDKYNSKTK